MPQKHVRFRMDFTIKVVSGDEKSGKVEFTLEPDPRRYERREKNGESYLYDRFENLLFHEKTFFENVVQQLAGKPFYYQPQLIEDSEAYARSRRDQIKAMLEGFQEPFAFSDKSEDFLESLSVDEHEFVIASIDVVGSTKIATTMEPKEYTRLIGTILFELSEIVPKFHGHVLKYTGDGIIAYFPAPSFIIKNDLALDCVLSARLLVRDVLNPLLADRGYPSVELRIGLDSGEAHVVSIGSPETKRHKDIIGAIVSLAAKIQGLAKPGEVCLGETTARNLYIIWRQLCVPLDPGPNWPYKGPEGEPYKVFKVTLAR